MPVELLHQQGVSSSTSSMSKLVGRDHTVAYGPAAREMIQDSRVLVTGAGGSIGSEIVRQLHSLDPAVVYMLDHDESALHQLQLELRGHGLFDDDRVILADIRDRQAISRVIDETTPEIIFHAAAHKHLPLLERYPREGVKTNVLGTLNVVRAAVAAGVGRFVNISTDKAARPASVLGMTKRIAEMTTTAHAGGGPRLASVRFGNVLGSRGSFLQGLAYQIAHDRPVTITHPDVTRYFMTIPEAAGLVIEAAVMADEGETYVLDMGEPVRILDLVHRFVEMTATRPPVVHYTGLRPGEKLHEVLLDDAEVCRPTGHARISAMIPKHALPRDLMTRVDGMHDLASNGQADDLLAALHRLLPNMSVDAESTYRHSIQLSRAMLGTSGWVVA